MVKTTIEIDDSLDKRFRETVAKTKGIHKGVMSESLEEALDMWIKEQNKRKKINGD